MTIEEALVFFKNIKYIYQKLKLIDDVGLGYIKLGQAANTLSGGEAQRIKITKELLKRSNGKNVYILDEPTTGLHFEDIEKLIKTLQKLNEEGNTIIMVEHNLDIVKIADYIIDLGPDAGENGGEIIAEGSPEEIINNKKSITGKFLKEKLRSI
jgi:excinuclease ABC subunit A